MEILRYLARRLCIVYKFSILIASIVKFYSTKVILRHTSSSLILDWIDPALCPNCVCFRHLLLNSARQGSKFNIFKTTKCCKEHSALHIRCASLFARVMDASYKFDSSTYEDDENTQLYCFLCEKNCFYCGKKYLLDRNAEELSVDVCKNAWNHGVIITINTKLILSIRYVPIVLKREKVMRPYLHRFFR